MAILEGVSELITIVNGMIGDTNNKREVGEQIPMGDLPSFDAVASLSQVEFEAPADTTDTGSDSDAE